MLNNFTATLMLSCHNEKHLKKIPELEAECIMLNLEDGVSIEEKPLALALCIKYLDIYKDLDKMFVVRVNALDEGGLQEIKVLNKLKPDAIRVPKIRTKKDVQVALDAIDEDIELHLSIETAESWNNLSSLRVQTRITTFYLGILDLLADMNLAHSMISENNPTINYILSHYLITCLSMGVKPVSFVYQDYKNLDEFSSWLEHEKSIGFKAKACISPAQISLVKKFFAVDTKDIQKAKRVVELFERQRKLGTTGFVDNEFGFIDEPVYKGALALLNS